MKTKLFTLLLAVIACMEINADPIAGGYLDGILYNLYDDYTAEVAGYNNEISSDVVIPDAVRYNDNKYDVTSIGQYAFSGCTGLTSIEIPNGVESIGLEAFYQCTGLTSVTIGNSVTSIERRAFWGCSSLTSVTIGNSVTSIGSGAFSGCSSLTSVTIGNSVTSIGSRAFSGCSSLTSIKIPNSVRSIGEDAFSGCEGLPVIDNIRYADTYLVEVVDKTLSSYNIIEGTKWIGDWAFYACIGLTSIEIPNSVTDIGIAAFNLCPNLTSVVISNGVTSIGQAAFAECSIKNIVIGASVGHIGDCAFARNTIFEYSEEYEKKYGFGYRPLDEYTIETITCYNSIPPTVEKNKDEEGLFMGEYDISYSSVILYVPSDCITAYKNSDAWKDFIIRAIEAKESDVSNLQIETTSTTVEVAWPSVSGAATYELVIKDKNGNVICTLIFNANGQLTQIAFSAPSRDGAPQQTQGAGFSFTVTGLEQGKSYDLTITAKDENGATLDEKKQSFHTDWASAIDEVTNNDGVSYKILRDGQVLIQRGDKLYTLQGQEVK